MTDSNVVKQSRKITVCLLYTSIPFEAFPDAAGGDEGESGASHTTEEFDGVSLVEWNDENKIISLKEFVCNINNYDPYNNGCEPEFKNEDTLWF